MRNQPREFFYPFVLNTPKRGDPAAAPIILSLFTYTRNCIELHQPADQGQSRIEENPHKVYEVPVDCSGFHAPVFLSGIQILARVVPYYKKEDQSRKNVEG